MVSRSIHRYFLVHLILNFSKYCKQNNLPYNDDFTLFQAVLPASSSARSICRRASPSNRRLLTICVSRSIPLGWRWAPSFWRQRWPLARCCRPATTYCTGDVKPTTWPVCWSATSFCASHTYREGWARCLVLWLVSFYFTSIFSNW